MTFISATAMISGKFLKHAMHGNSYNHAMAAIVDVICRKPGNGAIVMFYFLQCQRMYEETSRAW